MEGDKKVIDGGSRCSFPVNGCADLSWSPHCMLLGLLLLLRSSEEQPSPTASIIAYAWARGLATSDGGNVLNMLICTQILALFPLLQLSTMYIER